MRELFTADANDRGLSRARLRWGATQGKWRLAEAGVWAMGPSELSSVDRLRAAVLAARGIAWATPTRGFNGPGLISAFAMMPPSTQECSPRQVV